MLCMCCVCLVRSKGRPANNSLHDDGSPCLWSVMKRWLLLPTVQSSSPDGCRMSAQQHMQHAHSLSCYSSTLSSTLADSQQPTVALSASQRCSQSSSSHCSGSQSCLVCPGSDQRRCSSIDVGHQHGDNQSGTQAASKLLHSHCVDCLMSCNTALCIHATTTRERASLVAGSTCKQMHAMSCAEKQHADVQQYH